MSRRYTPPSDRRNTLATSANLLVVLAACAIIPVCVILMVRMGKPPTTKTVEEPTQTKPQQPASEQPVGPVWLGSAEDVGRMNQAAALQSGAQEQGKKKK